MYVCMYVCARLYVYLYMCLCAIKRMQGDGNRSEGWRERNRNNLIGQENHTCGSLELHFRRPEQGTSRSHRECSERGKRGKDVNTRPSSYLRYHFRHRKHFSTRTCTCLRATGNKRPTRSACLWATVVFWTPLWYFCTLCFLCFISYRSLSAFNLKPRLLEHSLLGAVRFGLFISPFSFSIAFRFSFSFLFPSPFPIISLFLFSFLFLFPLPPFLNHLIFIQSFGSPASLEHSLTLTLFLCP